MKRVTYLEARTSPAVLTMFVGCEVQVCVNDNYLQTLSEVLVDFQLAPDLSLSLGYDSPKVEGIKLSLEGYYLV